RDQCSGGRANSENRLGSIEPISQAASRRPGRQANCSAGGEHDRDRLRRQVATVEKSWQVRRLDTKTGVERAIQYKETPKGGREKGNHVILTLQAKGISANSIMLRQSTNRTNVLC